MKERPILFSAPMVRAILAGTKTQTRRVVKPRLAGARIVSLNHEGMPIESKAGVGARVMSYPHGHPGDRLWVREAWREWSDAAWHYAADLTILPRQRDRDLANFLAQRSPLTWESYRWRPSIHMPRAASRITLEITGVRVERLQDISEGDAIAEGIEPAAVPGRFRIYGPDTDGADMDLPRASYRSLWTHINGPGSWDANPWVWVVEFKRV